MKDILFKQNGWMHIVGFIALTYILRFWGNAAYDADRYILVSGALAELHDSPVIASLIVYLLIVGLGGGIVIEAAQGFLKKIPFSLPDILCSVLGVFIGFVIYQEIPRNIFLLIVSILTLAAGIAYLFKALILTKR